MVNVVTVSENMAKVSKARLSLQLQSRDQSQQQKYQNEDLCEVCSLFVVQGGVGGGGGGVMQVGGGRDLGGPGGELIIISVNSSIRSLV